jgi:hypothetical protein
MIKAAYDLAKQREAVDLTVRGRHRCQQFAKAAAG